MLLLLAVTQQWNVANINHYFHKESKLFFSSLKDTQSVFHSYFLNPHTFQAYDLLFPIGTRSVVLNLGCTLELPYTIQIGICQHGIPISVVNKVLQVIPMCSQGWEPLAYSNTFISQTSLKMLSEQIFFFHLTFLSLIPTHVSGTVWSVRC